METKATKIEFLKYIRYWGVIEPWQLWEHFGYNPRYVWERLAILKREGLVINHKRGHWEVTDLGLRRLIYYGEKI